MCISSDKEFIIVLMKNVSIKKLYGTDQTSKVSSANVNQYAVLLISAIMNYIQYVTNISEI